VFPLVAFRSRIVRTYDIPLAERSRGIVGNGQRIGSSRREHQIPAGKCEGGGVAELHHGTLQRLNKCFNHRRDAGATASRSRTGVPPVIRREIAAGDSCAQAGFKIFAEMLQARRGETLNLGLLVEAPEPDALRGERTLEKFCDLGVSVRAALDVERPD
jgi:hypothetical protein